MLPIRTGFDLVAVPLYSLCTSTESNMQTPSRNRDSRRSRSRCGRVAAKLCDDERSQTGTQRSTQPNSCSPPALQSQSTTIRPKVLAVRLPEHSSNRTPERRLRLHTVGLRLLYVEFPKARLYVAGPASAIDLRSGRPHNRLQAFPRLPLCKHPSRSRRRSRRQFVRAATLRHEAQTQNA